jgi:hypothetical protein
MSQPENKGLQKPDQNKSATIEPEFILSGAAEPLINARIVQILLERNDPEEVERLMKAELDYNEKRLQILRENAEKHPDAIEERETRRFRRWQYKALISLLFLLVGAAPFVPLAVSATFGILCILIVSGVLVNAREREIDLAGLVKIINVIIGRKQ